jgi:hypothetical protein
MNNVERKESYKIGILESASLRRFKRAAQLPRQWESGALFLVSTYSGYEFQVGQALLEQRLHRDHATRDMLSCVVQE